ncbi:MAG: hypothetical protein JOZ62_06335 [Acidobacteriaceae bacterium]|nr:hypothetical protein [Acidobacteriaceae bacterium]
MLKLKLTAVGLLAIAVSFSTGCNPQPKHPNQINAFDGASYDSLTLAHAALTSLRMQVATTYPQYKTVFNQAAASYGTAYSAYSLFRIAPAGQASAALAISNLTVSLVTLENAFQTDMHVTPNFVSAVRTRAQQVRNGVGAKITISDILSELEIAATIAATVPGTQPYSELAMIVIKTTQEAIAAYTLEVGRPIDLSTIQPIPAIS